MPKPLSKMMIFPIISVAMVTTLTALACEDLEVADYNPEFRPVPTIERAPTVEIAPTIAAAPTTAQFQGFKQAPTAETFEGFKQAPTVTQFDGFNEGNPCETFLENPTPRNAEDAAEWAMGWLDGAGGQIDPNDPLRVTTACQAVLNR